MSLALFFWRVAAAFLVAASLRSAFGLGHLFLSIALSGVGTPKSGQINGSGFLVPAPNGGTGERAPKNRCRQGPAEEGVQSPGHSWTPAYVFAMPLRLSLACSSAANGIDGTENGDADVKGVDTPSRARQRGQVPLCDTLIGLNGASTTVASEQHC